MVKLQFLASLLIAVSALMTVRAQDPTPQEAEIATAALQARLDAITSDASIANDLKVRVVEVLGRAVEAARVTDGLRQKRQRHAVARSTVATRLAACGVALRVTEARVPGPPSGDSKLAALEQGLLAAQQAQTDAQRQASELEQETARRSERRTAIPIETTQLKTALEALSAPPAEILNVDQRLAAARRLAWLAERERLQNEIETLAAELQVYDAEVELLRSERDLAARRMTATKVDAEAWLAALQPLRAAEAQRAEKEARESMLRADPRVVGLANRNAELAKVAAAVVAQREIIEHEKRDRDAERQRLQQDFDEVRRRAQLVGATDAVGALLRQRRTQLNETNRTNQRRTRSRRDLIADTQMKSLDFDERRRRLIEDPETWLQRELGGRAVADGLPADVMVEALRLRNARRDLLTQLTEGHNALLTTLVDVDTTERQLGELIARYRAYVAERVLGIRSSPPLWYLDWNATGEALAWFTDLQNWQDVGGTWLAGTIQDAWPVAVLVVLLALLGLRRLWWRRLLVNGEAALKGNNVAYAPTARAALDTALLIAPLPALCWFLGWQLAANPEATDFAKALSAGSTQGAFALLLGSSIGALVRPKGLGEAHFRWQSTTITHWRRALPTLLLAMIPTAFVLAALELPGEDSWLGSLGGLLLTAQLGSLTVVFWRLLHPSTGFIGGSVGTGPSVWFRFRRLWFLLTVGTSMTLLLMVVLGYEYTALQLTRRLQLTMSVLLLGAVVQALVVRRLVLERRRLQMRRTQERLKAAKTGEAVAADLVAQAEPDPQSLARRTQTLLRGAVTVVLVFVVFQIWVDVLPALGILRRFELWTVTGGTEAQPTVVTLADLLLSLFVLASGIAGAHNLPALLELLLLQRLRMQPGERHAVSTLARYFIIAIGTVLAFACIGIGWAKVQWLVAAVSVGLGFGLQEVFANFVSGLILLFEQPIRLGDIVTVGTTTGRVTRIQIRATTIQDWEKKELIVPNRQFVTSTFVNWTLTDPVVRWTIPVGVAYGSDTPRALRILEEIAAQSRFVLKDPPPEGVFTAFGESTLSLQLRVFVDMNTIDYRWLSELHEAIALRFREAGIEMALPQRDVNVKLPEPLMEIMRRSEAKQPAGDTGHSAGFPTARRTTDR